MSSDKYRDVYIPAKMCQGHLYNNYDRRDARVLILRQDEKKKTKEKN